MWPDSQGLPRDFSKNDGHVEWFVSQKSCRKFRGTAVDLPFLGGSEDRRLYLYSNSSTNICDV